MKVALSLALLVALLCTKETFSALLDGLLPQNLLNLQAAAPINAINDVVQSTENFPEKSGNSAGNAISLTQKQDSGKGLVLGQIAAPISLANDIKQQTNSGDASGGKSDAGLLSNVVDKVGDLLGGSGKGGLLDGVLGGVAQGPVGGVAEGPVGGVLGGGDGGVLGNVLGNVGTGVDGVLSDVLGGVAEGTVGGVLGGGDSGLLGNVLGTVGTGVDGLLGGVLGTGGLLGGVLGENDGVAQATSPPILPPSTSPPFPPYKPLSYNSGSGIPANSANTASNTIALTQTQNNKPVDKGSGGLLQDILGSVATVKVAAPVSVLNKIEQNANAGPGSSDCAGNTIGLEQSSGGNSLLGIDLALPISVLNTVNQNSNCNGAVPTVRPPITLPPIIPITLSPTLPPIPPTLLPTIPPTRIPPYKYNEYPYGNGVPVPGSGVLVPGSGVPVPGGVVPTPGTGTPVPGSKPPATLPSNAANTVGTSQTQNSGLINTQISIPINLFNEITQIAQSGSESAGPADTVSSAGLLGKLLQTLLGNKGVAASAPNIKPATGTVVPASPTATVGNFIGSIQQQNVQPGGRGSSDSGGLLQDILGPLANVQAAIPVSALNNIEQNANAGSGSSDCAGNTIGLEQSSGGNSLLGIDLSLPVSVLNTVNQNSNCNGVKPTVRPPITLPPIKPPTLSPTLPPTRHPRPTTLPPTLPPTRLPPYKNNKYPYGNGVPVPGSGVIVPGSGVPIPGGGVPAPGNGSPVPGSKPPATLPSNAANTVGVFQTQNAGGSGSLINLQLSALINLLNQISQTAQSGGTAENTVGAIQQQGLVPDDPGSDSNGLLGNLLSAQIGLPLNIGNIVTQEANAASAPNIKPAAASPTATGGNFIGSIQQQNVKPGGKGSSDSGGLLQDILGPLANVQAAIPVSALNNIEQNANAGSGSSDCAGNTIGLEQSSGGNSLLGIDLALPVSVLNTVNQNSNCNGVEPTVRPPITLPPIKPPTLSPTLPPTRPPRPTTLPPTLPPTRLPPYKNNEYPYGNGVPVPGSGVIVPGSGVPIPGGGVPAPGNGSPVPGSKPPATLPNNAANTVGVFQTQNAAGSGSLINTQLDIPVSLLNQISQTAQSGGAAENTVGVLQQQGVGPADTMSSAGLLEKLLQLLLGNKGVAASAPNNKPATGAVVPASPTATAGNFIGSIQQQNVKPGGKGSSDSGGLLQDILGPLANVQAAIPVSALNNIEQNANAGSGSSDCAGDTIGLEQSSGGNSLLGIDLSLPVSVLNTVNQNSNCNGVKPTVRPPITLPPIKPPTLSPTLPPTRPPRPTTLPPTLPPIRIPPNKYNKYPYGSGVLVPGGGVPAPGNVSPVPGSKPPATLPNNAANTVGVFQTQNAAGSGSLINTQLDIPVSLLNQISQTAQSGGAAENTVGVLQQQSGESSISTGSVPVVSALPVVPPNIPPPYLPTYLPPALPPTLPALPPALPPIMLPNRRCYRRYCKKWRTAPRYFCCNGGKCPDAQEPGTDSYPGSSYNLKLNPDLAPLPNPDIYITPNQNPNAGSYAILNQDPKVYPDVSVYLNPDIYPNPTQLLT